MKVAQNSKKDASRLVRKLDQVIVAHREYFSDWRTHRWTEFETNHPVRVEPAPMVSEDVKSNSSEIDR